MKINPNRRRASIRGTLLTFGENSAKIPKYVALLDNKLKTLQARWVTAADFEFQDVPAGNYVVRVSSGSGILEDTVVQMEKGRDQKITVNLTDISPRETQEWVYFSKFSEGDFHKTDFQSVYKITAYRFSYADGRWGDPVPEFLMPDIIQNPGEIYNIGTVRELSMLRLSCDNYPDKFIWLPPEHQLKLLIRPAEGPVEIVHPLEVILSAEDWKAETVMTLLKSGDLKQARSLMPEAEAEQLLYDKRQDPAAAAIGGYYLLKVGALNRMHHWAENLANWFPYLPDGPVIRARQLLLMGLSDMTQYEAVRTWLLEAIKRGMPVFTEGLRLLYESLIHLDSLFKEDDREVHTALKYVRDCVGMVDWSMETTTFNATYMDFDINFFNSGLLPVGVIPGVDKNSVEEIATQLRRQMNKNTSESNYLYV